jgi:NifU-like protein involved in Fe-S cluster formation
MTSAAYSAEVKRRCLEAPRAGSWPETDARVGTGTVGSLDAGTMTRLQVRIDPARRVVEDARFTVFGCSAAIASASVVADQLVGKSLREAGALEAAEVARRLQLPADKHAMAAQATDAARMAVGDWERKEGPLEPPQESGEMASS